MASTIGLPVRKKLPTITIPYFNYFVAILLINIILIVFIILIRNNIPPIVPLFYGLARGDAQLAPQLFLLLPPSIAILVTIINAAISTIIEEAFLKRILTGIALAATLLSTITIIQIIILVGRL